MGIFSFFSRGKSDLEPGVVPLITSKTSGDYRPFTLIILDGYGNAPPSEGNAIFKARKPNMEMYTSMFPCGELIASGESVGLPANEDGNSEVGHLTIGAGRVMYQSVMRVNNSIKDGTFFNNAAFLSALEHARKYNSKIHLMGLVGSGGVHSSIEHLYALLEFFDRNRYSNVFIHAFTDGRDAPQRDAERVFTELETRLKTNKIAQIASISGRYYAMDRDLRWDRTERVYNAIVNGKGIPALSTIEAIKSAYAKGQTDEFIEPTVITRENKPVALVNDNDSVIFFNFRIDRPRQLTMAFTMPDFEKISSFEIQTESDPDTHGKGEEHKVGSTFTRERWAQNVYFVTMTEYQKNIPVSAIGYPPETADRPMPAVLAEHGLSQLHLAESEKERMVTFYFDGMRDEAYPGTDEIIVPSKKISTYDKRPEMSANEIVTEFKKAIAQKKYHFIILNFANPDMVGHTGNMQSTVRAIEIVDRAVGEVVSATVAYGGTAFITADHGNAEELLTFPGTSFYFTTSKGEINTEHSNNPVPFIVINSTLKGRAVHLPKGALGDVATTILAMMGLPTPPEMTGRNLMEGVI